MSKDIYCYASYFFIWLESYTLDIVFSYIIRVEYTKICDAKPNTHSIYHSLCCVSKKRQIGLQQINKSGWNTYQNRGKLHLMDFDSNSFKSFGGNKFKRLSFEALAKKKVLKNFWSLLEKLFGIIWNMKGFKSSFDD